MKCALIGLACGVALIGCKPLHDLDAASSGVETPREPTQSATGVGPTAASTAAPTADQSPSPTGADPTNRPQEMSRPETGASGGAGGQASSAPVGDSNGPTSSPSASGVPTQVNGAGEPSLDGGASEATNAGDDTGPSAGGGVGAGGTSGYGGQLGAGDDATLGAGGADAGESPQPGGGDAPELSYDFPDSPVQGSFTVSEEAEWEVEGVFLPTFEIHTPTASYWLVKSLGRLVSMSDRNAEDVRQWIDFSSGFRPLRGLPSTETFDAEEVVTTLDEASRTPSHLRLISETASGQWRLVYDFFPTHVTLTVNAAPIPYGIVYRGVPAGSLDDGDRFVLSDGTVQSAMLAHTADLAGPAEWAYVADTTLGRSLFFIQHEDDSVPDRYQVRDNDSAMFSFGDGELTTLPLRFSFGLLESAQHTAVAERVDYVLSKID